MMFSAQNLIHLLGSCHIRYFSLLLKKQNRYYKETFQLSWFHYSILYPVVYEYCTKWRLLSGYIKSILQTPHDTSQNCGQLMTVKQFFRDKRRLLKMWGGQSHPTTPIWACLWSCTVLLHAVLHFLRTSYFAAPGTANRDVDFICFSFVVFCLVSNWSTLRASHSNVAQLAQIS